MGKTVIKPTIGAIVHYHPWNETGAVHAAIIVGIDHKHALNLVEFNFNGVMTMQAMVPLVQGLDYVPVGHYATWPEPEVSRPTPERPCPVCQARIQADVQLDYQRRNGISGYQDMSAFQNLNPGNKCSGL